jgi:hypothetical protein
MRDGAAYFDPKQTRTPLRAETNWAVTHCGHVTQKGSSPRAGSVRRDLFAVFLLEETFRRSLVVVCSSVHPSLHLL